MSDFRPIHYGDGGRLTIQSDGADTDLTMTASGTGAVPSVRIKFYHFVMLEVAMQIINSLRPGEKDISLLEVFVKELREKHDTAMAQWRRLR